MKGGFAGKSATRSVHLEVFEEVLDEDSAVSQSHVYSYKEAFTGFAAKLTEEEKENLARMDNVVAVFPSRSFQLQTTRSWDFLGFSTTTKRLPECESDLIVGVFDTGIWPESESFKDGGFGPPRKWKGICQNITCYNKLVGARFYYTGDISLAEERTIVDIDGRGTHTASLDLQKGRLEVQFRQL
ncbi:subtilisin-like protease SBT4.11 [Carica papaya]|uniref:subtilisin-like protease SBT4.11 n=1 Tax=Carica papaya TaxID=3649 RepID=UPI000B8D0DFE|nr:subtilisin-like protease SBT4.11 [Carica papaya]